MILDRRIGDIPVLRRYIGDTLVWERETPPSPPWTALVNFGLTGKTSDDIAGWNNVKATSGQIAAGATYTGIKDTEGGDLPVSFELSPATVIERTSEIIHDNAVDQKIYNTSCSFDQTGGSMTISGLDDDKYYKVTLIGCAVLAVAPYILFYTRCVLNGIDLPIQQDHDIDFDFDRCLYYIRAIDVKPVEGELLFEFYPTTHLPPQYNIEYSLSGLKIEEYSQRKGWENPVDIVPMGDSPVPYVIKVPETVTASTPLIISLPTGGTEGIGTGSPDHINWIFCKTLVKPLLNESTYLPSDCIFASPQFLVNDWNQGVLAVFIDHLIDKYALNGQNIYLMGFSAGMEVGLAYIGEGHRPVKAGVFGSSFYSAADYPGEAPSYADIAATGTPLWLFGSNADPIVPLGTFLDVRTQLLANNPNYPVKMTLFVDDTHYRPMFYLYNNDLDIHTPMTIVSGYDNYVMGEIWEWMFNQ